MGRNRHFSADRLLNFANSSNTPNSTSDLLDLQEHEIWSPLTLSSPPSFPSVPFHPSQHQAAPPREATKSAPVSVPQWGRMKKLDDVEGEEEWVPPHEYVARVHGKTAVATSVFEGVGRTLKGRDMSRVRDAVWSRTGFFG